MNVFSIKLVLDTSIWGTNEEQAFSEGGSRLFSRYMDVNNVRRDDGSYGCEQWDKINSWLKLQYPRWHRWGGSNGVTSWIPPVSAWVCGYSFLQYCENHDVFGSHSICHYIWWSGHQYVHVLQPYRPRAKNHTLYHRRGLVVAICKCGRRHPGRLNVSHAYTGSFLHTMHLEFCEIYTYIAPKSYRG